MQYEYKPSFLRCLKSFRSQQLQNEVKLSIKKFILSMEESTGLSHGIGFKKLKGNFYEIRSGLATRVVFHKQSDLIEFVLVGNHDDIKRFLRTI